MSFPLFSIKKNTICPNISVKSWIYIFPIVLYSHINHEHKEITFLRSFSCKNEFLTISICLINLLVYRKHGSCLSV